MTIGTVLFHVLLFQNIAAPIQSELHRICDPNQYALKGFEILEADQGPGAVARQGLELSKHPAYLSE
jgi:hypothetical protein